MKLLKSENTKLYQKIQILLEENNVLKDLAKLQSNDKMARQVAKKELAMEKYKNKRLKFSDESEKKSIKRFKKRNVQSDSKESDGSEYERIIQKKRKRQVKKQQQHKNTDVGKRVTVAKVIVTMKSALIVKKSR